LPVWVASLVSPVAGAEERKMGIKKRMEKARTFNLREQASVYRRPEALPLEFRDEPQR